jgi:group I intron endonuclease
MAQIQKGKPMPIIYLVRKDGMPVYVGFTTKTIEKRWQQHQNDAANPNRKRGHLQNAIAKYGSATFAVESLYESEDIEYSKMMEIHYIWLYQTFVGYGNGGYNLTLGGDAILLPKGSHHRKGGGKRRKKSLSEETKQKMRLAKLGKKRPPEVIAKYANSLTGRKLSDEHRKNISLAKKKIPDFSGTSQDHNK